MDAKQFAWLYLIEHGLAAVSHSFYGGYDITDTRLIGKKKIDIWRGGLQKLNDLHIAEFKNVGVDWEKTSAPSSDYVYQFAGTFADNHDKKETLAGTLVLKNGQTQQWVADSIEVTNVFEMMAAVHEAAHRYTKIFGDK